VKRTAPLPPDLRNEVLAALTGYFAEDRPTRTTFTVLVIIPDTLLPELQKPLEKLLQHRSYVVARTARERLVAVKLAEPTAAITPPPPPLKFRVTMNGAPIADTNIGVYLAGTITNKSNADGVVTIGRESLLEPEKIRSVDLSAGPTDAPKPAARNADDTETVWPGPWLEVKQELKDGADREIDVPVTGASLEITFDPKSVPNPRGSAKVMLTRLPEKAARDQFVTVKTDQLDTVVFQRLQSGSYRVDVEAEGATFYQSKPIELAKTGSHRLVQLAPGRSLTARLAYPDGSKSPTGADSNLELSRNGVRIWQRDYRNAQWTGLPMGKYHLHVPSTAERAARLPAGASRKSLGVPHRGYDRDIELTADSPFLVDLGEIKLQPE
jgi:hypothetical protein